MEKFTDQLLAIMEKFTDQSLAIENWLFLEEDSIDIVIEPIDCMREGCKEPSIYGNCYCLKHININDLNNQLSDLYEKQRRLLKELAEAWKTITIMKKSLSEAEKNIKKEEKV
jgi:Mg2+ and Co2+ transporter CorA